MSLLTNTYDVHKGEFETAGDASASIKRKLKQLGVDSAVLRRVAVASYEAELNLIIHSLGGQLTMEMNPEHIVLISRDVGPGIADIDKAMQEGIFHRQRGGTRPGLWRRHGPAEYAPQRRRLLH